MIHNDQKIIIIDGNYTRRRAILDVFRELSVKVYRYNIVDGYIESEEKEEGLWDKCDTPPESFDLLLIHARDDEYRNLIDCNVCIWYGGYEGYDPRVPEGEYKIYRKILDIDDCLTEDEANDLLLFTLGKIDVPNTFLHPNHKPDIQNKIEILHELMNPGSISKNNIKKILSLGEPGEVFLEQFKSLLKANNTITPFDEDYIQILDELRSKIIDGNEKNTPQKDIYALFKSHGKESLFYQLNKIRFVLVALNSSLQEDNPNIVFNKKIKNIFPIALRNWRAIKKLWGHYNSVINSISLAKEVKKIDYFILKMDVFFEANSPNSNLFIQTNCITLEMQLREALKVIQEYVVNNVND